MRGRDYLRLTGAVLLTAILAYGAASFSNAGEENFSTVTAKLVTVSESFRAEGMIIRREVCVRAKDGLYTVAADHSRIACGSVIAADNAALRAMDSEIRAERLRSSQKLAASDPPAFDAAVQSAACALRSAEGISERKDAESELSVLLGFPREPAEPAASGGSYVYAPCAGTFLSRTDGYESINYSSLCGVTASELRRILSSAPDPTDGLAGKILPSGDFYFAAVIGSSDSAKLGSRLYIDLGTGTQYPAILSYLSPEDRGFCAAVFRCDADSSQVSDLRFVTAEIICRSFEGIRVPRAALITGDGGICVRTVSPAGERDITVEIVYEDRDFCLAAVSKDADGLREGMNIVIEP